jgi:hypothetical protein
VSGGVITALHTINIRRKFLFNIRTKMYQKSQTIILHTYMYLPTNFDRKMVLFKKMKYVGGGAAVVQRLSDEMIK